MKRIIVSILLLSQVSLACPGGQHDECALWNPFANRCAQWVCVPSLPSREEPIPPSPITIPGVEMPDMIVKKEVQKKADTVVEEGHRNGAFSNYDACMMFCTGALALWGAQLGGPYGAAAGGAMGYGASILACRKWFPEGDFL